MIHTCEICNKQYESNTKKLYCSKECLNIAKRIKNSNINKETYINNMLTCKICGYKSLMLTNHIHNKHHISKKEYCTRFNCLDSDIVSPISSNNISNSQKKLQSLGHKTKFQIDNPAKSHNGNYSPFSRNFIKYIGLSEEEITDRINELIKRSTKNRIDRHNDNTKIEYYIKRGCSLEEAKQKLAERQATFSLKKCIQKYGIEEGTRIWKERQSKWQNTLNNLPLEEKNRIYNNKIKSIERIREQCFANGYSKISQELFQSIHKNKYIQKYTDIYYAIFGTKPNNEYEIQLYYENENKPSITIFLDFYIKSLNKCIEFDGDYWHSLEEVKEKDIEKDKILNSLGIQVLHIKECDYCKDPKKITNKCIKWLLSDVKRI